MSEKFKNVFFTLKTFGKFSAHTTPEKLKTQQSPVISGLCLWKARAGKSIVTSSFRKVPFTTCTLKRKAGVFEFFRFEDRFRKAPFSQRIRVTCTRPRRGNKANKAVFSNFSGVLWMRASEPSSEAFLMLTSAYPKELL